MRKAVLQSYLYAFRQLPKNSKIYTKFFIEYINISTENTVYKHINQINNLFIFIAC